LIILLKPCVNLLIAGLFHIEGYGEDDKVNSGLLYSKMMEEVDDVGCWLPLIHV
jgi:hypothetical protein